MGFRTVGVEVHGQLVAIDGTMAVAGLHPGDTHVIPRIGVLRVVRQRPLVEPDAARQIACARPATGVTGVL